VLYRRPFREDRADFFILYLDEFRAVRVQFEQFPKVFSELIDNAVHPVLVRLRWIILKSVAAVRMLAVMGDSIEATISLRFPRDRLEAQDCSAEPYTHL